MWQTWPRRDRLPLGRGNSQGPDIVPPYVVEARSKVAHILSCDVTPPQVASNEAQDANVQDNLFTAGVAASFPASYRRGEIDDHNVNKHVQSTRFTRSKHKLWLTTGPMLGAGQNTPVGEQHPNSAH